MSQSPYVYDNKNSKPAQAYGVNNNNNNASLMGSTGPGLSNYTQASYTQYPQAATRPQQQQSPQQQAQHPQPTMNRTAYGNMAPTFNQYDQQQVYGSYGQPVQQYQQQQQTQSQQPNYYQQGQPQAAQPYAGGVPQFNQSSFMGSYNQGSTPAPTYQATTAAYGYPATNYPNQQPAFNTNENNSPYKQGNQMAQQGPTSGSNINMATIRGGLQSATAPPLIDPNQVPQRPKLTTTFWEDENTVCYQVESRGISVSRREDTNFINGTKLLNVAGMTRGRRDGILKSELFNTFKVQKYVLTIFEQIGNSFFNRLFSLVSA